MNKYSVKAANIVLDQLTQRSNKEQYGLTDQLSHLVGLTHRLASMQHKYSVCRDRHFHGAITRLRGQTADLLSDLSQEIEIVNQAIPVERKTAIPTFREIVAELEQLEAEFGQWDYNSEFQTLSVTTDSIELEGFYLGPFEISLNLRNLADLDGGASYAVIAKDPNPAASSESVTHPHVRDERLCPGDAVAPIRAALKSGRLCDFFLLVQSVLQNYNSDSPFVSLGDWEGIGCNDCGYVMGEDDRFFCEACENDYCSECISGCRCCDLTMCRQCLQNCPVCEETVCNVCLSTCSNCSEPCCESCLEDELCPQCKEEQENEDEIEEDQEAPEAGAEVGQTAEGIEAA